MNDLVVADVGDPSAWDDPVVVGPSKGPRRLNHARHLELASKFYVLSVLHRLGADASMTFSHSDNVDITVVVESGHALTVDVKTLTGSLEWRVGNFRARSGHFVTFVRYTDSDDPNVPPEVYIVASDQLQRYVAEQSGDMVSLAELDKAVQAREAWQHLAAPTAA
jgi:hypothetical protein